MGGPGSGEYWIRLATDPQVSIGVEDYGAPVVPVIANGSDDVWTVTGLEDGNYTLVLKVKTERPRYIQADDWDVVGNVNPPPHIWFISGPDGGPYTIEVPNGTFLHKGWTMKDPRPGNPVTLHLVEIPLREQQWNFIPWPGPEESIARASVKK